MLKCSPTSFSKVPSLAWSSPVRGGWSRGATSYRPDKNGFVKQQIRRGIGLADTLTQLDKGNSPGRYVNGIYVKSMAPTIK